MNNILQKLEKSSKLLPSVGSKEEKIALYKDFIQKGVERGTYDKDIVVDRSLWSDVKGQLKVVKYGVVGFIKCNWKPEDVAKTYAQDKITIKISETFSKALGKLTSIVRIKSIKNEKIFKRDSPKS